MSQFINIGIDLGTTTTEVCIYNANNTQNPLKIIKSGTNMDYIPSAIWVKKNGNIIVGQKAYDTQDIDNRSVKFKRLAGTDYVKVFENSKKKMSVEQLQSEILKEVKALTQNTIGYIINSAVITVPAQFTTNQKKSTQESAELAGFNYVELLQEPVAAAMAFANISKPKVGSWLIYDLGGGTFDVAIVKITNEEMITTATQGHPQMGGSDIDTNIVNNFILPVLKKSEYEIDNLIANTNFKSILALKAEDAKKNLTTSDTTTIDLYGIKDENDEELELEIPFTKKDLESCIESLVMQSFEYCEKALSEAKITKSDLVEICLVGGPTQIPFVRKMIEDYFGKKPNISVDPTTAVAKGACIFAQTKMIPDEFLTSKSKTNTKQINLKLDYKPIIQTDEQFIVGVFETTDAEFIEVKLGTSWSSGRIAVKDKKFGIDIPLTEGYGEDDSSNSEAMERFEFTLNVFGKKGLILDTNIPSFIVVKGLAVDDFIVAHTIGLKKNDGKFHPIIEKGERYPIQKSDNFKYVDNPDSDIAFVLEVIEMDELADTSSFMKASYGITQQINIIKKSDLKKFLVNDSEIIVQYNLDKSGNLISSVYIKSIDQLFQFQKVTRIVGDSMESDSLLSIDFQLSIIGQMKRDSSYMIHLPILTTLEKRLLLLKHQYEQQDEILDIDQISKFDHECREIDKEIQKIKMDTQGVDFEKTEIKMQRQYEIANTLDSIGCDTVELRQKISRLSTVNIDKEEQDTIIRKEVEDLVNSNFDFQKHWFGEHIQALQKDEFSDIKQATLLIQSGRDYISRCDSQGLSRINSQLMSISTNQGADSDSSTNWLTGLTNLK
jgi:molecular chaperone DnaK